MKIIIRTNDQRQRAIALISQLPLDPLHEVEIKQYRASRSKDQNARMWAMLHDVAKQVVWHGQHLSAEEWKSVFTAALKQQKVVPGIDSGFVVLGTSTRNMTVAEMSDLMELMTAFGAERDVKWSAPEEV